MSDNNSPETGSMDSLIDSLPTAVVATTDMEPSDSAAADATIVNAPNSTEADLVDEVYTATDLTIAPQSVAVRTTDPVNATLLSDRVFDNDMNPQHATDSDNLDNHRQNSSVHAESRETPREILLAMGPYALLCTDHYLQSHRISEENGSDSVSNRNNDLSEYSSHTAQRQTLFLPASPNGSIMLVDEVNVNTLASEKELNKEMITEDMNQPVNQEIENYEGADISQLKRPYISRTLLEVENATKNWFLSEQNRNTSLSQSTETTDFFSLQFNETSLSTIALWVAGGPKRKCASNNTQYRPIVDTRFRVCCICHRFGHYEVECQKITPDLTIQFSQWMTKDKNSDEEIKSTKNDVFQKKYDITIEMCDGYMIEQRSQEDAQDVRYSKSGQLTPNMTNGGVMDSNIVQVTRSTSRQFEIDDFIIQEGETIDSLSQPPTGITDALSPSLSLDDKRANVHKGCLVTWSINTDGTSKELPGTLAVGTVADIDRDSSRVQVNFLKTIEPKINGMARQRELPMIESLVWVPANLLYYVDGRNYLLPTDNIPVRKKRKYTKLDVVKKAKTHEKPATARRKNKSHLTHRLISRPKSERMETGPSKLPRSGKRDGLIWDAKEGVWVLPPEDA